MLIRLVKRADYLAANSARRAPMPGFVLLVRARADSDPAIRIGITVSKKVGNAVVRNRMKRRFRELARAVLTSEGVAGADHVLIGRVGGIERDWAQLHRDLVKALAKVRGPAVLPHGGARSGPRGAERARSRNAGPPPAEPLPGIDAG